MTGRLVTCDWENAFLVTGYKLLKGSEGSSGSDEKNLEPSEFLCYIIMIADDW